MVEWTGREYYHVVAIVLITLVTLVSYSRLTGVYYCGYDDFREVHRAAFEDSQDSSRIFTTSHFGGEKYRPLNRWINYTTYRAGEGNPRYFRIRNCGFHLLNAILIYCLSLLLFHSRHAALSGALLFAVHPLANQPVAGAVMTNTAAASFFLLSLLLFLISYNNGHSLRGLHAAILCVWIGALIYEANVAALGIMVIFAVGCRLLGGSGPDTKAWWVELAASPFLVIGSMLLMRSQITMKGHLHITGLATLIKNATLYCGALFLPIDPLLANRWFGMPMPSDFRLQDVKMLIPLVLVLLVGLALSLYAWIRSESPDIDWMSSVFLVLSAVLSITPLLLFNEHASETYVYLPLAFSILLFSYIAHALLQRFPIAWGALVALLLVLSLCGTLNRIQRVERCGNTAREILSELPFDKWRSGKWVIIIANYPGEPVSRRYGLYGYKGLDTIGTGDGLSSVAKAIQLKAKNQEIVVDVLASGRLLPTCKSTVARDSRSECLWVHWNGQVELVPVKTY